MKDSQRQESYDELAFYTLSLQDHEFIHQHIIDAQTVQTADENTKAISLIFSLVGLYLHTELNFTGKEIQQFHLMMATNKELWRPIALPHKRGDITVKDVIKAMPGSDRNRMIHNWCVSVWKACEPVREHVVAIAEKYLKKVS